MTQSHTPIGFKISPIIDFDNNSNKIRMGQDQMKFQKRKRTPELENKK
jgi:hypothetical protein